MICFASSACGNSLGFLNADLDALLEARLLPCHLGDKERVVSPEFEIKSGLVSANPAQTDLDTRRNG